jgi:hypothetical protein
MNMSPVKRRAVGKPILVGPVVKVVSDSESESGKTVATGLVTYS